MVKGKCFTRKKINQIFSQSIKIGNASFSTEVYVYFEVAWNKKFEIVYSKKNNGNIFLGIYESHKIVIVKLQIINPTPLKSTTTQKRIVLINYWRIINFKCNDPFSTIPSSCYYFTLK